MGRPVFLYFVDRGRDRPEWHRAPYHRYLICTNKNAAYLEAGDSDRGACVWSRGVGPGGEGWLWERWHGLDIDYAGLVKAVTLPDGCCVAFVHPHRELPPWTLLSHAVWWSDKTMPEWLAAAGVRRPEDSFSREAIERASHLGFVCGKQKTYVYAAADVLPLTDWLEKNGFADAARAVREQFGSSGFCAESQRQAQHPAQADLFGEG